jgi:hypothetical protein
VLVTFTVYVMTLSTAQITRIYTDSIFRGKDVERAQMASVEYYSRMSQEELRKTIKTIPSGQLVTRPKCEFRTFPTFGAQCCTYLCTDM